MTLLRLAVGGAVGWPVVAAAQTAMLPDVTVVAPTPLLGSGVDRDLVPAQTQVLTGAAVTREGPPNATRALETEMQGVHLNNAAGNPFQPDLFYHGFQASPLQGTSTGIAVYLNGARFNSPFGDTVNWDLIPALAIDRMDLEGANPVFGLNALGGALSIRLKNGFTYHGGEIDAYGGSFGQVAGNFQYGRQSGNSAVYVAGSALNETGWRDEQSSLLKQFYGDVGWHGDKAELHINVSLAQSSLDGPGTVPVELLVVNPRAQLTGPNAIDNNDARVTLNGNYDVNDTTSLQVLATYDNSRQVVINGNGSPLGVCGSFLCASQGVAAVDPAGNPIPAFLGPDGVYGSLATQTTNSNVYGASAQVTNSDEVLGHANQLVVGASFDGAHTGFAARTAVGGLDASTRDYFGPGTTIDLPGGPIAPVRANITDAYVGVFFTDTFAITQRLSANVSGRFNAASIDIDDLMGTGLTGNHDYTRFNPAAGLTFKLTSNVTLYGGYAESNRAPTPAELTCSSPASPCSLANFFTGDPDLKQVVARTWEAGVRGGFAPREGAKLTWNVGLFRADLNNDILFAQSSVLGTGFFENVGSTRRQGVDAGLQLATGRWLTWIDYSYTDATFQTSFLESSPNNPAANDDGNILVGKGNQLPGIPAHMLKFGAQYKATDKWTVGGTGVATSGSALFGDEANLTPKLPAYARLDFNTSYQLTDNVQVFGLVQNALNARYYTYGTFSPTGSVPLVQAPAATNTRSTNIAAPIGGFGGVKVTF